MSIQINGTSGISGVDGSATTPALQGTDTNTGLSFGTNELSLNTAGSERFRVGSAGQLGIGGATYGTSGQVLTSGGASAAPSWGDVSTGNDFNFDNGTFSGSSITISSLPADAMKIVIGIRFVYWSNASTSFYARLRNSSGQITSGYDAVSGYFGATQGVSSFTNWWMLNEGFGSTNNRLYGTIELNKKNSTEWHITYHGFSSAYTNYQMLSNGTLVHSGTIEGIDLAVNTGSFGGGSYGVNVFTE